jgi:hypothetical protein
MADIRDAFSARKAAEIMADTWGHLKPKKDKTYFGWILYTRGEYGDIVSIGSYFTGLASSPWYYEDLHDFLGDNSEEHGHIYIFEGTYCRSRTKKFIGRFARANALRAKTELFVRD